MPSTLPALIAAERFSFRGLLQAGDCIVCGQAAAEPSLLARTLMREALPVAPLTVFLGTTFSRSFDGPVPQGMRFLSYGAIGRTSRLADRGLLDILPERYSRLAMLFEQGRLKADVVLLQLAPGVDGAGPSCGLANDYAISAARRARVVVAQRNARMPWTHGTQWPADLRITHWVDGDEAPLEAESAPEDETTRAIAQHLAPCIPDRATLQTGVGALPDAMLRRLSGHRGLGIHSGVLSDAFLDLLEGGAADNAHKGLDAGVSVANTVYGTARLYDFVHRNPAVEVRHSSHTHDAGVLGRLHRFHAINTALQIDLSGQVNCEAVAGKQRGGIGGLLDFCRAARASAEGRSVTVLNSTAADGSSRVLADLGSAPVTIGRADVDLVVTEHGVADLRDVSLDERAARLIAVAAPQFRDRLRHAWRSGRTLTSGIAPG